MADVAISEESLRRMLKQAVADALEERRDLLHDVIAEVMEDYALTAAIREGQQTAFSSREEVMTELDDSA